MMNAIVSKPKIQNESNKSRFLYLKNACKSVSIIYRWNDYFFNLYSFYINFVSYEKSIKG